MSDYEMDDGEYVVDDDYNQEEEYNQIEENTGEYEFLKKDGFEKKRNEQIEEFVEYSSLSKEEAEVVLISYQWNFEKLSSVIAFETVLNAALTYSFSHLSFCSPLMPAPWSML